ncbi:MAG: radical SAM protein [Elusimicrobiota bacterium]
MSRKFKYYIKEFGCRINQYDARLMMEKLSRMGNLSSTPKEADVIIINTCGVTHRAERDGYKYARRIKRLYPDKELLAAGCSVRASSFDYEVAGISTLKQSIYLANPAGSISRFYGQTRAFLKVQQGCRGKCTYCTVRKLKKPYYGKNMKTLMLEARDLAVNHPEIVLCATNFNEYSEFTGLAGSMGSIREDFRWRFSSVPVGVLSDDVITILSEDSRFCRHFHIPLQSASDKILTLMNRGYDIKKVSETMGKLKTKMPDTVFSFDIIVGFPGETRADLKHTLDFIRDTAPVKVHVFRYSERPGTIACSYDGKVPESDKRDRMLEVKSLSESIRLGHFRDSVGKIKEMAVEKGGSGYTRDYLPVKVDNRGKTETSERTLEMVRIINYNYGYLSGEFTTGKKEKKPVSASYDCRSL